MTETGGETGKVREGKVQSESEVVEQRERESERGETVRLTDKER